MGLRSHHSFMFRFLFALHGLWATIACAGSPLIDSAVHTDWISITLAAEAEPGCPALTPDAIYLRQVNGQYTFYRVKRDPYGGTYYTEGISLTASDFLRVMSSFSSFYEKAKNDETFAEYLAKLPEDVRERELRAYDPRSGRSFGGFGGTYILFSLVTGDGQEATIWEEFSDWKVFKEFLGWMDALPAE